MVTPTTLPPRQSINCDQKADQINYIFLFGGIGIMVIGFILMYVGLPISTNDVANTTNIIIDIIIVGLGAFLSFFSGNMEKRTKNSCLAKSGYIPPQPKIKSIKKL
jgi:hypothetical protein